MENPHLVLVTGCFLILCSIIGGFHSVLGMKSKGVKMIGTLALSVGAMLGLVLVFQSIGENNDKARRQAQAQTQASVVQKLLRGEEISGAEYGSLICSFPTIAKEMKLPPEVAKKFGEPWRFTIRFNTNDIALEATNR